ncbi:MAG: putative sulfate exporter family transporter [Deltaproteobacteria bacterium]|nr:putative sulfate exporter family transporter [Deltaproteobacteria bacterium]
MAVNTNATPKSDEYVVMEKTTTNISDLWKKEDWMVIWLGFIILIVGMIIFFPRPPAKMQENIDKQKSVMKQEAAKAPFKTIAWHKASAAKKKIRARDEGYAKTIKHYLTTPDRWSANPLDAVYRSKAAADAMNQKAKPAYEKAKAADEAALAKATAAEKAAAAAGFKDPKLNQAAEEGIGAWLKAHEKASKAKSKASNKPFNHIPYWIGTTIVLAIFFGIGQAIMGASFGRFFVGFFFVFLFAILAYMGEMQNTMKHYGFGFPLWAIIFGMLVSNTVGTPKWVKPAVQTEYYIKTGLVLLGAEILFNKIVSIGLPGIFIAWVCAPAVLIFTYWFGQNVVKMPSRTLNITISADMSVCGVSAAIATAAACRAKKEELTLAIGLSMVFTAICMVAQPAFARLVGMNEILAGAWMGATIDSTGAVAAAGAFYGEKALYVAATIKMIQNMLIGVTAFCVAYYWCAKIECAPGQQVSWWEIWHRFPKFVLGFIAASIVFSLIDSSMGKDVADAMVNQGVLRGWSRLFREWFFALAFTSIGLDTNFREFGPYFKGGKPVTLYVVGQGTQLCLSLFMVWLMFFVIFPGITAGI